MKSKCFATEIYGTRVHLIQVEKGDSYKDLPKELVDEINSLDNEEIGEDLLTWFDEDTDAFDAGYVIGEGRDIYVIFSRSTLSSSRINTFAHELYHVTNKILRYCGVEDEEAGGYLQGYLANQFYDFYLE